MYRVDSDGLFTDFLNSVGFSQDDNFIYKVKESKYTKNNADLINVLISHPELVNEPLLCLPDGIVFDKDTDEYIGTRIPLLKGYNELGNLLAINSNFDRYKVLKDVARAIKILSNNGISYYDVHVGNIMVNNSSEIKLIDIDGAEVKNNEDDFWALFNYVELVITTYFPSEFLDREYILYNLLEDEEFVSFFSNELVDYFTELNRICNSDNILKEDLSILEVPYERTLNEVAKRQAIIKKNYIYA